MHIQVLCDQSQSQLGGVDLDLNLANYLADLFDKKRIGKPSIKENSKIFLKLIKEGKRIKEILSSNKDAQVYLEGLADGMDLITVIERSKFEELN